MKKQIGFALALIFSTSFLSADDRDQREWEMQQLKNEAFRQKAEMESIQRQQQAQIDEMKRQQQGQLDQMKAESQQQAQEIEQQKNQLEIQRAIITMENSLKAGNGLSDDEVKWVKSVGNTARNVPYSIYRPYLARLTAIYNAEKARRGR